MVKAPKDKVGASPLKSLNSNCDVAKPLSACQTELSCFCEMKYLFEKETHAKNEENTLKELNEIFLMVYGLPR